MATGTLTGSTIAGTYKSLLKVTGSENEVLDASTTKVIEDGDGNPTPLKLSQDTVDINSGFELGGSAVTASATELNVMDGSETTQATVTLEGTDGVVISDGDTMKQALVSDFDTYGISTSQTLTNKSIDADNNTITNIDASELGVTAGTVTASKAVVVDASKDIDWKGGRILNEQGRQDHVANTMPAPYYRFDGVNDYIDLNSHISAFDDLKENASTSVLFRYIADGELISHGWGDKWTTSVSSGKALLNWRTSDESESVFGSTDLVVGNIYCIVGTYDGANLKVYLSGVLDGTEAMTGDILNRASSDFYLGRRQAVYNESEIYAVQFWNKALTATEVKELYSGASVPFKYKGANQTNLWDTPASVFTSGTYAWTATGSNTIANVGNALAVTYESATDGAYVYFRAAHDLSTNMIVGARYRFSVDAKYAGGSACSLKVHNGSSAEPTQTLTTSTVRYEFEFTSGHATNGFATFSGMNAGNVVTIDNLSIVRIGAVAEYDGSGVGKLRWNDKSGNDLHGTVTGATVENAPADADSGLTYEEGSWTANYGSSTDTGSYTKIGNLVRVNVVITNAETFSEITGLPFTPSESYGGVSFGRAHYADTVDSDGLPIKAYTEVNGKIIFVDNGGTGQGAEASHSVVSASSVRVSLTAIYKA